MNQDQFPSRPSADGERLQLPSKLYGRQQPLRDLVHAFQHVCRGHGTVLLVPGKSGSGKTSLVREIRGEVEKQNGLFLEGKFDQYHQDVPYFAIRAALSGFCRELAHDDSAARDAWRSRLLPALGGLAQLVIDLVPELETLLGQQPAVPDISPLEASYRFVGVLRDFLHVLCRPEHPAVLFLDDVQWADAASAELLTRLQIGSALRQLLVVATYREEEVDASHPWTQVVEELRRQAVPVEILPVQNLAELEVRELLADTLRAEPKSVESLAALVHRQTEGNPFFARTLITTLCEEGLLWFDRGQGTWRWNVGKLGRDVLPASVVQLFGEQLRHLEPATLDLLALAACLGNQFELSLLAMISQRSGDECRRLLGPVLAAGLVLPLDPGPAPETYRFWHDRVQQAAYDLIPGAELPQQRLRIGRLLRKGLSEQQLADRLYQVAENVNASLALVADTDEQVEVVRLNTLAARKARAATAYHAALQFHRAAATFLEVPGFATRLWSEHHTLAQQLFLDRAESEFLEGDRHVAEECLRQAVAHAASVLEKAEALNTLIVQFTLLARYPEAIAAGREALASLGILLPEADFETVRDAELAELRAGLRGRTVAELADLPVMTHPEMRMAAKLLITLGPPCYRAHQRLWSVIVPKVVNLTVRYGNLPQIGYSHTAFAGLIGWVANDYALTKEFGALATRLMTDRFDSPSDRSVFYLMRGSSVQHWCAPLRASSQDYAQAYEIGRASGNLQYAAYAFGHNMYCRLYQGTPLPELIQETEDSLAFSRTRVNQWAVDLLAGGLKILAGLRDEGAGPDADPDWEREYLRQVAAHQNIQVECIYQVNRAFALLLLGRCQEALAWSDRAAPLIYTVGTQGLLPWPEHVFVRALILARLISPEASGRQAAWRAELERLREQLHLWTQACPENFAPKRALVAAEVAAREDHRTAALRLYREAIDLAAAAGFVHWEGLAHERAAEFLETCGQGRLAQAYWQDACRCYEQWGATAKVRALEAVYDRYLPLEGACLVPGVDPAEGAGQEFRQMLRDEHLRQLRIKSKLTRRVQVEDELLFHSAELTESLDRLRHEAAERRRAEQLLRESEGRYRNLVMHAPDAIFVNQRDRLTLVNHACVRLFGARDADELLGKSPYELFHPDDHAAMRERIHRLRELGEAVPRLEERAVRLDGQTVDVEVVAAPFPLGGENAIHVIVRDISARKQAEEELRRHREHLEELVRQRTAALETSETRYRLLFEQAPESIVLIDAATGEFLDFNSRAHEALGYSRAEFQRLRVTDIDATDSASDVAARFDQVRREGSAEFETRQRTRSGEIRNVLVRANLLQLGGMTCLHCLTSDITASKRAERAVRESEENLRVIYESSRDGILAFDTTGRCLDCNPAAVRMFGCAAKEDLLGENFAGFLPDRQPDGQDSRELFGKLARETLACGSYAGEVYHRRVDGSVFPVEISASVAERDGQPIVHGIGRDVTERRRVADELRQAKEAAETADRAKSTFLANMSHEIRTPMTAILGFTQLMLGARDLASEQRQHLRTISRAGEHLLEIINGILELARIESGREMLKPVAFDLPLMLDDLERMFRLRAMAKDQQLHVERQGSLPPSVIGDETKLRQVFINLLGNAVKFTPHGGTITLRVAAVPEPNGKVRVRIEVQDTGEGIAPEDVSQLFEPFFQTRRGEQVGGGSGLGLCISRTLVRLMGGQLTASSQLGLGSLFRADVQLALDDSGEPASTWAQPPAMRLRPGLACRVLVADDQPDNRDLLAYLLIPLGFDVRAVNDGLEAVTQCGAWQPHVVLLDLRMPVLDGFEAARRIRERHGTAVKILALSAGAFAENQQQALAAGADAFLTKPFSTSELLTRIRELTGVDYVVGERPATTPSAAEAAEDALPRAADLSRVTPELVVQLLDAARAANYSDLLALIDEVQTRDESLARQLRQVVKRFDYTALRRILCPSGNLPNGDGI